MRRVAALAVAALMTAVLWAAPARAHNDDCIVAVHAGRVQVHPACG